MDSVEALAAALDKELVKMSDEELDIFYQAMEKALSERKSLRSMVAG